jgi:hypothetical protein
MRWLAYGRLSIAPIKAATSNQKRTLRRSRVTFLMPLEADISARRDWPISLSFSRTSAIRGSVAAAFSL